MTVMILHEHMNEKEEFSYGCGQDFAREAVIHMAEKGLRESCFFYADAIVTSFEQNKRENIALVAGVLYVLLEALGPNVVLD